MTSSGDTAAIKSLLEGALAHISWNSSKTPDWDSFLSPYLDGAVMIPSARPAKTVSPEVFKTGMEVQRSGDSLAALEERPLATVVRLFGNVAIAQSSFGMSINQDAERYGINSYLLAKSEGTWRIAAVAWDDAVDHSALPDDLQGHRK